MVDDILRRVTEFGDQAVILPVVAGLTVLLFVQGRRAASAAWLIDAGAVLAAVLIGKLMFLGCGHWIGAEIPAGFWPNSPSGHTASAAMVLGNVAMLVTRGSRDVCPRENLRDHLDGSAPGRGRSGRVWQALAAALFAAGLIGLSRVVLGAHSVADVVAGGLIGCLGTLAFALYLLPRLEGERTVTRRPGWNLGLLLALAGIAILASGQHLGVEAAIMRMANTLVRGYIPMCYKA